MSELCCINITSVVQALSNEASSVQRTTQRILQEVSSLEADMLRTLSEQTSAEKSSSKTAADIRSLRAAAESEEMLIAEVQNELARLAVDALNTQGHNDRLKQALQLLDAELKDKVWRSTFALMP
jgi:predicted RNase H-like nuclease (RuvC/YqgF family)